MNVTIKNSLIKNRVKKVLISKICEKNILITNTPVLAVS